MWLHSIRISMRMLVTATIIYMDFMVLIREWFIQYSCSSYLASIAGK